MIATAGPCSVEDSIAIVVPKADKAKEFIGRCLAMIVAMEVLVHKSIVSLLFWVLSLVRMGVTESFHTATCGCRGWVIGLVVV